MSKNYQELYNVVSDIEAKAYNRGYNAGKGIAQTYEEGYKLGCKDAWKFAAEIECMKSYEAKEAFGVEDENVGFLCNQFNYEEALQRFHKWVEATSCEDVPVDDMSPEQARQAVKDLRKELADSRVSDNIDVLEVTLLSTEEAEELPEEIRKADEHWWLRSQGDDVSRAAFVICETGAVSNKGDVDYTFGVRPVLKLKPSLFNKGDYFSYKGYGWDVIDNDLALCKVIVGKCAFRKNRKANDANDYESSDIKKWLDDWWQEDWWEDSEGRQG